MFKNERKFKNLHPPWILSEFHGCNVNASAYMLRTNQWKYIAYSDGASVLPQLFGKFVDIFFKYRLCVMSWPTQHLLKGVSNHLNKCLQFLMLGQFTKGGPCEEQLLCKSASEFQSKCPEPFDLGLKIATIVFSDQGVFQYSWLSVPISSQHPLIVPWIQLFWKINCSLMEPDILHLLVNVHPIPTRCYYHLYFIEKTRVQRLVFRYLHMVSQLRSGRTGISTQVWLQNPCSFHPTKAC